MLTTHDVSFVKAILRDYKKDYHELHNIIEGVQTRIEKLEDYLNLQYREGGHYKQVETEDMKQEAKLAEAIKWNKFIGRIQ